MKIKTTKEKVESALNKIQEVGKVNGNRFEAKGVSGRFHYEDGILEIRITDKPFLAPMRMVEDKIKEFFA